MIYHVKPEHEFGARHTPALACTQTLTCTSALLPAGNRLVRVITRCGRRAPGRRLVNPHPQTQERGALGGPLFTYPAVRKRKPTGA